VVDIAGTGSCTFWVESGQVSCFWTYVYKGCHGVTAVQITDLNSARNSITIPANGQISGRYKSLIVDESGTGYLKTVCDYVHLNPVRVKLLKPEQERIMEERKGEEMRQEASEWKKLRRR